MTRLSSRLLMVPMLLGLTAADGQPALSPALSPGAIVEAAPAGDWTDIAADDLLVMTLAPDAQGRPRAVLIQLIAPPFSAGWVANIRALARAHWYDGIAVVRAQDNYVVQWGDPDGDAPDKARALPAGLATMSQSAYTVAPAPSASPASLDGLIAASIAKGRLAREMDAAGGGHDEEGTPIALSWEERDSYADRTALLGGWPIAADLAASTAWPVHCYGMVGVARSLSPNTGTGAELYAVIGQAPRHLDRNVALVGRIVEGMELLSALPRGTGALGFYETPEQRVAIRSIRLASDLPAAQRPHLQTLSTESESFAHYAEARANRRAPFFIVPAGGADVCNIPVPIRRRP